MNPGNQLEIAFRNQNPQESFLEDVPEYEKKVLAWQYLNLPEDERIAKFQSILAEYGNSSVNPRGTCSVINRQMGFLFATPNPSSIHYLNTRELAEYCADILDEQGQVKSARESFQKAA